MCVCALAGAGLARSKALAKDYGTQAAAKRDHAARVSEGRKEGRRRGTCAPADDDDGRKKRSSESMSRAAAAGANVVVVVCPSGDLLDPRSLSLLSCACLTV